MIAYVRNHHRVHNNNNNNNNNNNIHLYGAISNLKLLFGATNKNVNKHDQLGTLR